MKTPRFLLAACISLALTFTFSCSSDDGNDSPPAPAQSSSSNDGGGSSSSGGGGSSSSGGSNSSSSDGSSSSSDAIVSSSSSVVEQSSSSSGNEQGNYFNPDITYGTLSYGGKSYRTVQIGDQTWIAENLNHAVAGSKCLGEDGEVYVGWNVETGEWTFITTLSAAEVQANCAKYGRLYDWATAMDLDSSCNTNTCSDQVQPKHRGICPSGSFNPYGIGKESSIFPIIL